MTRYQADKFISPQHLDVLDAEEEPTWLRGLVDRRGRAGGRHKQRKEMPCPITRMNRRRGGQPASYRQRARCGRHR